MEPLVSPFSPLFPPGTYPRRIASLVGAPDPLKLPASFSPTDFLAYAARNEERFARIKTNALDRTGEGIKKKDDEKKMYTVQG